LEGENMDIAQIRIKELRIDNDLLQKEVAEKCNITQRKVSFIEKGKTEPNLEDLRQLCKLFNVSADYILGLPQGLDYPKR